MTMKGKRNKLTTCRIAELRMFMQTGRKWQVWEPLESYAQLYGYIRGTAAMNQRAFQYAVKLENLPILVHSCCGVVFLLGQTSRRYFMINVYVAILVVIVGIVGAFLIGINWHKTEIDSTPNVGDLVVASDEDGTYFFLKLSESAQEVKKHDYVILKVENRVSR